MWIILFAASLLLLGLCIGLRFPKASLWEWIDAVYYPLAICGVILLFLESESVRNVATLEEDLRDLSASVRAVELARPDGDPQLSGRDFVRGSGGFLSNITRLNRSCQRSPSLLPVCFVVEDLAPIIAPGEQILLSYDGPEDLGDVCTVAAEIFAEMAQSGALSGFLMRPIADHYFSGLDRGFDPLSFEAVQSYIDELRPILEGEASDMIVAINMGDEDRARMEPLYEQQIQWGMSVIRAFEACLRAPDSIRSGSYANWVAQIGDARTDLQQKEAELIQMRINANALNQAGIFRVSYWPFLIILALSLKFAKGVAALKRKYAKV
ncbi:hypothetical protein [Phaeobacter inhibens]|uniref:hypothetical protein n=1 Tax=Phaeobacter inhibens TaxID=221822 RepID=UPI0024900B14|nr:hypothetical protein [Phaeobacter inhibens]